MKAVNLLPERHRPRAPSGARSGSSYVLLGVLTALLIALVVYVLTLNSINSTKDQIAKAQQQTQRDNAIADELGSYGDFDKVKTQRVSAVKMLAEGRFDFERLMRELARVLPNGVWLTDANVGASGLTQGGSSTPAPNSSTNSSSASGGAPALDLKGCATSQAAVAVLLVRTRELQGATDATLAQSSLQQPGGGGSSGASSSGQCGNNYSFSIDVTFQHVSPAPAPQDLGGGS